MSISLDKGVKIDLTKNNAGLDSVIVGLGWSPAEANGATQKKGGILGSIFGGDRPATGRDIDIDASCFLLAKDSSTGKNNKYISVVYFANKNDSRNGIRLSGDDLTGRDRTTVDDNEEIFITLSNVQPQIEQLDLWANIYGGSHRGQTFGKVKNAYIRLMDGRTKSEICRYNLSNGDYDKNTAILMGSLYRYNGEWKFSAVGLGGMADTPNDIKGTYR